MVGVERGRQLLRKGRPGRAQPLTQLVVLKGAQGTAGALVAELSSIGTGRAILVGNRAPGTTGHAWNAVVRNGRVEFVDGQVGGPLPSGVLDEFKQFFILRTDNLPAPS